ncbi:hypothetical protein ANN_10947 [Periplaneta americana]|uniref:Uncharacterized protein n=1 Tax=Periplaneta americana TaxID=6978 RepID=A0ABQ8T5E9_PERAM|nr:hypothetical protein ANN_10947 [Periplaneta americana]
MYLEHSQFILQIDNQALSWVLARPRVKEAQRRDPELGPICERIQQGDDMTPYELREDIICYVTKSDQKPKVVVPNELVPAVLKYYHDSPLGDIWAFIKL